MHARSKKAKRSRSMDGLVWSAFLLALCLPLAYAYLILPQLKSQLSPDSYQAAALASVVAMHVLTVGGMWFAAWCVDILPEREHGALEVVRIFWWSPFALLAFSWFVMVGYFNFVDEKYDLLKTHYEPNLSTIVDKALQATEVPWDATRVYETPPLVVGSIDLNGAGHRSLGLAKNYTSHKDWEWYKALDRYEDLRKELDSYTAPFPESLPSFAMSIDTVVLISFAPRHVGGIELDNGSVPGYVITAKIYVADLKSGEISALPDLVEGSWPEPQGGPGVRLYSAVYGKRPGISLGYLRQHIGFRGEAQDE